MFLLNSCLSLFSAARSLWHPLSRSYRVILPSSLTMLLPPALGSSPHPPVSVYGTGDGDLKLRSFSREHAYRRCHLAQGARCTVRVRLWCGFACTINAYTPSTCIRRHAGVSLLRRSVAVIASDGILTVSSIGLGSRLCLRARLTLIRLALIRKPWSYGEGVSRPLCRYLYLHLLFQTLQHIS